MIGAIKSRMANSLAGDIGGTSRQRELWEIETWDRQLDAEKTGHVGGELKAMSHMVVCKLIEMG